MDCLLSLYVCIELVEPEIEGKEKGKRLGTRKKMMLLIEGSIRVVCAYVAIWVGLCHMYLIGVYELEY